MTDIAPAVGIPLEYVAGMKIRVTEFATKPPSGKPLTEDMRNMVEHLRDLGQIRRKPAAFSWTDSRGSGLLFIHPILHAQLERDIRACRQGLERDMFRQMTGL